MTSSLQKVTVNKDFINDIIKEMNTTIEKLKFENDKKDKIISEQREIISRLETPDRIFGIYRITKKDFLYNIQSGKCCYCHKKKHINEMTEEHLIPKSYGGTRMTGNLCLACKKCNNKRGNNICDPRSLEILQERAGIAWWYDFSLKLLNNSER